MMRAARPIFHDLLDVSGERDDVRFEGALQKDYAMGIPDKTVIQGDICLYGDMLFNDMGKIECITATEPDTFHAIITR